MFKKGKNKASDRDLNNKNLSSKSKLLIKQLQSENEDIFSGVMMIVLESKSQE